MMMVVSRLGGGFRAVAGGDMTDTQKARKYMNLLRVPGYERWNNSANFGETGQGRPRLHLRQERVVKKIKKLPVTSRISLEVKYF